MDKSEYMHPLATIHVINPNGIRNTVYWVPTWTYSLIHALTKISGELGNVSVLSDLHQKMCFSILALLLVPVVDYYMDHYHVYYLLLLDLYKPFH